jgi:ATPase family associated with various cellular activities (AAA)
MPDDGAASRAHLLGRLAVVEARVRSAVERRRADDPAPDDPFRGLYLSEQDVTRVLAATTLEPAPDPGATALRDRVETEADATERAGAPASRLRRLRRSFGLSPAEVELLLVAVAPDLDSRFERLYGYLNDDVTRRRATVGLAFELCGLSPMVAATRRSLGPGGALVDQRLVLVEEEDRPFLTRALRVPDRVTGHLLGDDRPDSMVAALATGPPTVAAGDPSSLARGLAAGARLCYLRERPGGAARTLAVGALAAAGWSAVSLDLARMDRGDDPVTLLRVAAREAGLRHAGLVAGPIETLVEHGQAAVRAFASPSAPVLLIGQRTWDPAWTDEVPLLLEVAAASQRERARMWLAGLGQDLPAELEAAEVGAQFVLTPEQIQRATRSARLQASLLGTPVSRAMLRAGARAQNAGGLERLARRIEPAVGWEDLVLPAEVLGQLRGIAARARLRDRVLREWSMRPGGGRGHGIAVLFAGESGTGKTMSAEVIAHDLGLDLFAVDLATVVDKYVGETEKNLERIFAEATGVNGVLLFDEADAIFGKRSEVRDAHDRYANLETAYLLQRMESFDGIAILATNLRSNVDAAFTRRLDAIVDFPLPDEAHRRRLWERCLGPFIPRGPDLDLSFCAGAFELSGGDIRSIALTAAYLAADDDRPVGMADLVQAIQQEYRKLGRLCLAAEFGPYHRLVS